MNTLQLSKPYIPNSLAPPNVNTFTLKQVNITEWSKKIRIIRMPNISGINRNFFVLEAMSQMFG